MPESELEPLARGRVWTGADAHERKLVDELGGFERAIQLACQRAGLDRDEIALTAAPHRSLLDRLRPPESTEDLAATAKAWTADGLTSAIYAALGLPPSGVLTMPLNWRLT